MKQAEQLRAAGIGLEFLTGELQGSHDPARQAGRHDGCQRHDGCHGTNEVSDSHRVIHDLVNDRFDVTPRP